VKTREKATDETEDDGSAPARDYDFLSMPGHLLRRCHQIGVAVFLDECRAFDLTPLQYGALAALSRFGPMDQVSLGGATALDRTTIATVLANLEDRGLVTRTPSDQDKRAKIVGISAAGRRMVRDVIPNVQRAQKRMLEPLTARQQAQLRALLKKMADVNNELSRAPHRLP
jgi:DNA-binding MarR family transcriptional regulator